MTTVNAFDSTRQPSTLELGERFNSPYDFYAWRNGQPFTFLAVVHPGRRSRLRRRLRFDVSHPIAP